MMKASVGACAALASSAPLAPTLSTATEASMPPDQPWLSRKRLSASSVMNRNTSERDCAPICQPTEPVVVR